MSLSEDQLKKAQEYNAKASGQRWGRGELPEDVFGPLAEGSPEFALQVAAFQIAEAIFEDGKLGPRTLQALIERGIEAEVTAREQAATLGWWTPGQDWPEAAVVAATTPPEKGETLDAYLFRHGCPHFSAFELTRLPRWARNVEPMREDWPNIIPTLRLTEILRHEIGADPLLVLSGYRPRRYNAAIGGAKGSLHPAFRSLQLGLDVENTASEAQQRQLHEVAARLFAFYGQALKIGLGFYSPKRGTQITIDTGYGLRTWQSDYVKTVVAELGLKMPSAAPPVAAPATTPPVVTDGGVPQVVFKAARENKLGGLTRIDGAAGNRYYQFDKGIVQYSVLEQRVVEVKPLG